MLLLSAWSLQIYPKVFVPALDKQYFLVDVWLPEGTNINETDMLVGEMAEYIQQQPETEMISTYIGCTPPGLSVEHCLWSAEQLCAKLLVKCRTSKESLAN